MVDNSTVSIRTAAKPPQGVAYVDGQIVPIAEAKIPLLDWGLLHSDATYDVVHVWQGQFFRLDEHLERFLANMKKLRLSIAYGHRELASTLADCVRTSELRDAYVEMICTRGLPATGSRDPRTCTNRFFAFVIPFVGIANRRQQAEGLHLIISRRHRIAPESVDPAIKNYHWLDMVMGLFEAYDRGGETAAVVDRRGNLVEGPGFNIFTVKGNTITTPARGMLEGITRRTAIELATGYGYRVRQQYLPAATVRGADEVFITSTAGGIMPVTRIDGEPIGTGQPGPVTGRLQGGYWMLHSDPRYARAISY